MTLMEVRPFDGQRNLGGGLDLSGDIDGAIRAVIKHGKYKDAHDRGALFRASNQAAQATTVALATTYTGLMLSNPLGSTIKMSLRAVGIALTVAPAGIASLHLIGGWTGVEPTHTTPLTPRSTQLGNTNTPIGKADSAATIPTPEYIHSLGSGFTAGALYGTTPHVIDLDGMYELLPGGFIGIGTLTVVTGIFSAVWEEIPL